MGLPLDLRRAHAKQRAAQDKINAEAEAALEQQRTDAEEADRARMKALRGDADAASGAERTTDEDDETKAERGAPENKALHGAPEDKGATTGKPKGRK